MSARCKPDQASPKLTSPTGVTNGQTPDVDPRSQSGAYLTTAHHLQLPDGDHARGPRDRDRRLGRRGLHRDAGGRARTAPGVGPSRRRDGLGRAPAGWLLKCRR
jgi:hypothetical protein